MEKVIITGTKGFIAQNLLNEIKGKFEILEINEDFLDKPFYKFVIVSNIALKVEKQFMEYKNTELFYGNELQINLIDHILIPKHF